MLTNSFDILISSFYSLTMGLAKKNAYHLNQRKVGTLVIFAGISFIIYAVLEIVMQLKVNYSKYVALSIATITFYDLTIAIYKIIKYRKSNKDKLIVLVNLASSLISLELTQKSILSFTKTGIDSFMYNGFIGIIVGISSVIIGIIILKKVL